MNTPNAVDIENLSITYRPSRRSQLHAVSNLSLSVAPGQVVGFIGPNGAGKTSTIKVLMGFMRPAQGKVSVLGLTAGSVEARERTGYLPEVALYYPFLTARETLLLYARLQGLERHTRSKAVNTLLDKVGLADRRDDRLQTFSKGMLQRIGLAQALMGDPDVFLLDEITGGLDPMARYDVREILFELKSRGKTVFFSSHELSEVALVCDRIVLIDQGRVLEERALSEVLASIKRVVVVTEGPWNPASLPEGVGMRTTPEGHSAFVAASEQAYLELREQLAREKIAIARYCEESGSLEDYFVKRIGHKGA
ncbi:MAG: ABC transporter ATP-binding protein [Candidatus Hydrogenedentes bacterium]|nr:ABC transporter ATP-binding protein [Candidatus Hydrogenedentota bacterium]